MQVIRKGLGFGSISSAWGVVYFESRDNILEHSIPYSVYTRNLLEQKYKFIFLLLNTVYRILSMPEIHSDKSTNLYTYPRVRVAGTGIPLGFGEV